MSAPSESPISTGLVGLGNSGRHYHLPHLRADDRFALRGIATSRGLVDDPPSDVALFAGWEELIEQDGLELVVIATPHHLHHPIAAAALDRGIGVLVEKPMTVTVAEADDLIRRAEASRALLAVHHQRRWERDFVALLDVVRSGEIGAPWRVTANRGHQGDYLVSTPERPHVGDRPAEWARSSRAGGGVLRVIGPHPIDHVLHLADAPVRSVSAHLSVAADDDVERWAGVEIDFGDGITGRAEIFRRLGAPPARFAVWGQRGMAVAITGDRVDVHLYDGSKRTISDLDRPGVLGEEIYDDVAAALRSGGRLRVSPAQAREVVRVIELAERSAAAGGVPLS